MSLGRALPCPSADRGPRPHLLQPKEARRSAAPPQLGAQCSWSTALLPGRSRRSCRLGPAQTRTPYTRPRPPPSAPDISPDARIVKPDLDPFRHVRALKERQHFFADKPDQGQDGNRMERPPKWARPLPARSAIFRFVRIRRSLIEAHSPTTSATCLAAKSAGTERYPSFSTAS